MNRVRDGRWIRWCVYAAFLSALPTAIWRVLPGVGVTMGTPADWRELQHLPGDGTSYVVGLSVLQVAAAACCLLLAVDARRIVPSWTPAWARRATPYVVGIGGLLGAVTLALIVVMSISAWDKVDPFAGQPYDAWAVLCLACYLIAIDLADRVARCVARLPRSTWAGVRPAA